ncbi:hypothetical protein Tco_1190019 [Tanacetum coccineum]
MLVSSANRRCAASSSAKSQVAKAQESSSDVEQSSAAASHRDNSEYFQPHVASQVSLAGTSSFLNDTVTHPLPRKLLQI